MAIFLGGKVSFFLQITFHCDSSNLAAAHRLYKVGVNLLPSILILGSVSSLGCFDAPAVPHRDAQGWIARAHTSGLVNLVLSRQTGFSSASIRIFI